MPPLWNATASDGRTSDLYQAELLQAAVLFFVLLLVRHRPTFALSFGFLLGRAATLGAFDRPVQQAMLVVPELRGRETTLLVVLVLLLYLPILIALHRRRLPQGNAGIGWPAGRAEPAAWGGRARLVWTTVLLGGVLCWLRAEPHLATATAHPHVAPVLERTEFHLRAAGVGLRERAFPRVPHRLLPHLFQPNKC